MATQDRTRHDRLRTLMPRAYATDAKTSALGSLLEGLADSLTDTDGFIERALRNKWIATAAGPRSALEITPPTDWVCDDETPALLRNLTTSYREKLRLDSARVLSPSLPLATQVSSKTPHILIGERALAPKPNNFDNEGAVLLYLRSLLVPLRQDELFAQLPLVSPDSSRVADPSSELLDDPTRAREFPLPLKSSPDAKATGWIFDWKIADGRHLSIAIAPAGAKTALAFLFSTDPLRGRASFRTLLESTDGFTEATLPGLPVVSMMPPQQPLELLGAALDLRRQPWETNPETYRTRVRLLAPMLSEGLATTRVMLSVALSSLHSEPCPVMERDGDSTTAYGLPPGSLARCRTCGGDPSRAAKATECPMRKRAVLEATLTDNPLTRSKLIRSELDPTREDDGAHFRVHSDSLFSERPSIRLEVIGPGPTKVVPSFRSLTTGEEVVVATVLQAGDVLVLRPSSPFNPEHVNEKRYKQHWVDRPSGESRAPAQAFVQRAIGGPLEDLSHKVMFASGPRFDQARFASADGPDIFDESHRGTIYRAEQPHAEEFAPVWLSKRSPELKPGNNEWIYTSLSQAAVVSVTQDYPNSNKDSVEGPSFDASAAKVKLELEWWTRPPARFQIRLPYNPALRKAMATGAADYMRQMIDRFRAAGVHPIIDFAIEPLVEDSVDPQVRQVPVIEGRLPLPADDSVVPEVSRQIISTEIPIAPAPIEIEPEEQVGFMGIFDVTRFDISRFNIRGIEPGEFNETYFDFSSFQDAPQHRDGVFDETRWDLSIFGSSEPPTPDDD